MWITAYVGKRGYGGYESEDFLMEVGKDNKGTFVKFQFSDSGYKQQQGGMLEINSEIAQHLGMALLAVSNRFLGNESISIKVRESRVIEQKTGKVNRTFFML